MKELNVEALARVEGDGGITVTLDGKKVKSVTLDVHEGPRLIEQLVKGMKPEDDLTVIPRICAICTLSHRYSAIRGLEKAMGIVPPEKTQLMRELMMLGEKCGEQLATHISAGTSRFPRIPVRDRDAERLRGRSR